MSALTFRHLSKGKGMAVPRTCGDPGHKAGGAARWRVALLDYPLHEGPFNVPLVVCSPCKNRLQKTYDAALGIEEKAAA